jgi:hypothetical protein
LNADHACVTVTPTEHEHWLTVASRTALGVPTTRELTDDAKWATRASLVGLSPKPLALVVALRFDASARVPVRKPLRGAAAARNVLQAMLRFDVEDVAARRREVDQLSRLHECVPMIELIRSPGEPRGVADAVARALGARGDRC